MPLGHRNKRVATSLYGISLGYAASADETTLSCGNWVQRALIQLGESEASTRAHGALLPLRCWHWQLAGRWTRCELRRRRLVESLSLFVNHVTPLALAGWPADALSSPHAHQALDRGTQVSRGFAEQATSDLLLRRAAG